jgi:hypothetical protein
MSEKKVGRDGACDDDGGDHHQPSTILPMSLPLMDLRAPSTRPTPKEAPTTVCVVESGRPRMDPDDDDKRGGELAAGAARGRDLDELDAARADDESANRARPTTRPAPPRQRIQIGTDVLLCTLPSEK